MPELPEVETVRRGLEAAQIRAPVREVWRSRHALRTGAAWERAREGLQRLVGATPGEVMRRGKYIVWTMASRAPPRARLSRATPRSAGSRGAMVTRLEPEGALGLLLHLGMSGRCGIVAETVPRAPHTHVVVRFEDGRELRLVDPRRFGGVRVDRISALFASHPLATLGPEPLDPAFGGDALRERLSNSTRAIRDALLDQRAVAGIGNIYAIEALFEVGVHPLSPCRSLSPTRWDALAHALRRLLIHAIERGGTTLKDFRDVSGSPGRNQDDLRVYGRAGQACPRCGVRLHGAEHSGRSFVFCPREQRAPRPPR